MSLSTMGSGTKFAWAPVASVRDRSARVWRGRVLASLTSLPSTSFPCFSLFDLCSVTVAMPRLLTPRLGEARATKEVGLKF